MRKIVLSLIVSLLTLSVAHAEAHLARYGVQYVAPFKLYNADGTLDVDEVDGGTEVSVRCQGGTNATATNDFVDRGSDYEITLTATEMQCATVAVTVAATTTEVFYINTVNHASAAIPTLDADVQEIAGVAINTASAQLGVNVVNFGGSAGTFASGRPEVNASHWGGTAVASATVNANATQISGDATAADNLELAYDSTAGSVPWASIIDQGTAQAASGTTLQLRAAAAFADDEINGNFVVITGGSAGVGQVRQITDYVSSTDTATVNTWTTTPSGTVTYQIIPDITAASGGLTASDVWSHSTRSLTILDEDSTTLDLNATQIGSVATGGITEASFATTAGSFDALGIVDQGTAQAATVTTLQLRSAATFADDEIIGATCVITGGSAGVGQARTITDYVSSTDTATVAAWTTTPSGTITYQCFGTAASSGGALTAADVWAHGTRTLTAFDEDSVVLDLDATIRAAAGLASANLDTQLSGIESGIAWNSAWDSEVESEANDAIVANHLDHLLAADYDPAAKPGVATALLNEIVESDAGVSRFTTNALEQAPTAGGGNITQIEGTDATDVIDARIAAANILRPTTAGRTLDVTATGEAGIDWANVGSPTTVLNLSGTTISTSQAIASVAGAVNSVTSGVTVAANNDKTGYALSSAGLNGIRDLVVEDQGSITLGCLIAAMGSVLSGDNTTSAGTTTFREHTNTETRLVSTQTPTARTVTITCPTY